MGKYDEGFMLLGIDPTKANQSGYMKCPKCSDNRKTALKRKSRVLQISRETGVYTCNHCDFKGRADSSEWIHKEEEEFIPQPQQMKTEQPEEDKKPFVLSPLNKNLYKYLSDRGISERAANILKIKGYSNVLVFNYYKDGEIVGAKYRKTDTKFFWQHAQCEKYLYNLDNLKGQKEIILTEGEMDVASLVECGFPYAGSVSQGAPNEGSQVGSKLKCLDNSIEYIKNAERVIIWTDNDANGEYLKSILVERFGADRCLVVVIPTDLLNNEGVRCKDVNEVLVCHGREMVKKLIEEAKQVPIAGVRTVKQVEGKMWHTFRHGYRKGVEPKIKELEGHFSFYKPWWNLYYGIPNSGKSEFVLFLMMCMSVHYEWKWAVFSPEHYPAEDFYNECIQKLTGRGVDIDARNRLTEEEYKVALEFVNEHFFFVYPQDDKDPETGRYMANTFGNIVDKIRELKLSKGIDGFLIDPINQVSASSDYVGTKDEKLELMYGEIDRLCKTHHLSGNVVAHPRTLYRDKGEEDYRKPTPYEIAGGAMNYNKPYIIPCVHRPFNQSDKANKLVEIDIQKVKKHKIAGTPACIEMYFDYSTGWYVGIEGFSALDGCFDEMMGRDAFGEEESTGEKTFREKMSLEDCVKLGVDQTGEKLPF